jgi:O-antigen/teichoic acid export membrane protein
MPFALIAIVLPVYYQVNIIFLSKLSGYEATGIFTAAFKIILMFEMISRLFAQVLFPTLAKLFITSKENFRRNFYYSFRAIALGVFPIAFGVFLIGDRIVLILFKNEFAGAIPALRIMAFSLVFSSLQNVLTASLNAGKQEKKVASVMIMATVTNIIINLILIPKFALIGASISALVSEIMRFTGNYYYFRKGIFKIYFAGTIGKVILACLIMSLFVVCFKQMVLPVLIIIAGLLYLVLIWLFGVVSNDEIKKLINLFGKRAIAAESPR